MKVRILGCSGGIGGGRHTTSYLLDENVLLDCGTGVTTLTHAELCRIDHAFITHSHLDHIAALPLLLDSVGSARGHALTLHGLPEVLQILKDHLFNWNIWPDFARIPNPIEPFLQYSPIQVGVPVRIGGLEITPIPARHVVPAVGYLLRGDAASLLFSGDTASHDALWVAANAATDLRHLIVECSFQDAMASIAEASKHYSPCTLAPDLKRLQSGVEVWITHLKPGGEAGIMAELTALGVTAQPLQPGQIFDL